ncbi:E3 ubiquitin-protein ligase Zswim2-like [Rhopilema esculentum]|uniref:E3 ubiquitin-protein ligase Zswim2-like n=1 Tax=Rhopilema esculentum TaxID=499914 RepID=UPI0031CE93EB
MSRSIPWRRSCPDIVKRRIDNALEARFYILRESGPTGFLVKQEDEEKKYKVYLGDPNSCTCTSFIKDKELCIHILWILLRKFRLGKENSLLFQQALVEREINEIIQGVHIHRRSSTKKEELVQFEEKGKLPAKSIDNDDVCPICQEEIKNCKEPLTHCKYGCGNNIHIKCMKVWAQHRKTNGDNIIKCPLCRSDFGSYQDIIQEFHKLSTRSRKNIETSDAHIGATCHNCRISPIQGKCFRCVVCLDYHLCQECFLKQIHMQHSFQFRKNTNQRWRPASRYRNKISQNGDHNDGDQDFLLNLNRGEDRGGTSIIFSDVAPLEVLTTDSREVTERLQCQMCCSTFRVSDSVRHLACRHTLHKNCIDDWVSRGNSLCPLDGQPLFTSAVFDLRPMQVAGKSRAADGNGELQLSIQGINSLNTPLTKNIGVISKPTRRRSRNISTSGADEFVGSVNELAINGLSSRRSSNTTDQEIDLGPKVQTTPSTLGDYNSSTSNTQLTTTRYSHFGNGLPPVHPKTAQRNRPSSIGQRRNLNTAKSESAASKQSNEDLTLGIYGTTSSSKDLVKQKRAHSNPIKKRLSGGAMGSISSSEPNLVALTDVFRVSSISHSNYQER